MPRAFLPAVLLALLPSAALAQRGAIELQQLQQRFAQERLDLQRQQGFPVQPPRLDQAQQQRQWLLQEQQRREALGFERRTQHLSEPEQRLQWQAEQQRLQRERDAQMLRFQQERASQAPEK